LFGLCPAGGGGGQSAKGAVPCPLALRWRRGGGGKPLRRTHSCFLAQGDFSGGKLRPTHNQISDYVAVQASSLPKIAIACLCWTYTVDMEAAARGYDFGLDGWVMKVVLRDLFLMVAIAGAWDYVLYFSPLKERLRPYKFNSKYPPAHQLRRDAFWTLSATLLASAQEVLLMRWWAGGNFKAALFGTPPEGETSVPWSEPFFGTAETAVFTLPLDELPGPMAGLLPAFHFHAYTGCFLLWTVTMLYWRIFHFWFIHRNMHPWWDRRNGLLQGDIGAFLYRWVHGHHHLSYNPTAFSGFSMTPVESIAYIQAATIPLFFRSGCHPWLHLYTKLDLIIGAQIGHDGFDAPGGGSYYHQLHHAHFECNYGDSAFPCDWLFGTFEDGTRWSREHSQKLRSKADKGNLDKSIADAAEQIAASDALQGVASDTPKKAA
jgi:hypothetical protein